MIWPRGRGQVCHSGTISALGSWLTASYGALIVNAVRLTMLRMRIDAGYTQRLQHGDPHNGIVKGWQT